MKRNLAAAVALPWLAFASAALANRPLNTDTADVLEPGTNQLEVYASHVTASGAPNENGWTAQLSHGFGHRTQLSAAVSRARAGDASATGALLGGKSWLIELGEADPGLSIGYGITGVKAAGDSWHHDASYLTLIGTQPVGKSLLVHANLGWTRSSLAKQDSTLWAVGLEYSTAAKVNVIAETFGDDRGKPTLSFGLLWAPLPSFSVNTSYGVTRETPRVKQWTLGFQLNF